MFGKFFFGKQKWNKIHKKYNFFNEISSGIHSGLPSVLSEKKPSALNGFTAISEFKGITKPDPGKDAPHLQKHHFSHSDPIHFDNVVGQESESSIHQHQTSYKKTALHLAAANTYDDDETAEVIKFHLENNIDPNAMDDHGETALHILARRGNGMIKCATLLIAHGAQVDIQNHSGRTPLHLAGKDDKMQYCLLGFLADPHAKDHLGCTPLHYAYDDLNVIPLLKAGANPEERDREGRTPLHHSTDGLHSLAMMACLLQQNVNPNARDHRGNTAFHEVTCREQVVLLSEAKGNPTLKNNDDETPMQSVQPKLCRITPNHRSRTYFLQRLEFISALENAVNEWQTAEENIRFGVHPGY